MTPISVHTPHVLPDETQWIERADELASAFDAFLCIHSMYFDLPFIPRMERLDLSATYGYENVPGASIFHLENMILEPGYNLILDTAHLYMGKSGYFHQLSYLFSYQ